MKFFRRRRTNELEASQTMSNGGGPARISITARWDFLVADPEEATKAIRTRIAERTGRSADDIAAHTRDISMAILTLFEVEGWDTSVYEDIGLEDSGSGANSENVDKTLYEMDDDERMESDF